MDARFTGEKVEVTDRSQILDDALSALINLGYKEQMVKKVLDKIDQESQEIPTLDILLKNALKVIAG